MGLPPHCLPHQRNSAQPHRRPPHHHRRGCAPGQGGWARPGSSWAAACAAQEAFPPSSPPVWRPRCAASSSGNPALPMPHLSTSQPLLLLLLPAPTACRSLRRAWPALAAHQPRPALTLCNPLFLGAAALLVRQMPCKQLMPQQVMGRLARRPQQEHAAALTMRRFLQLRRDLADRAAVRRTLRRRNWQAAAV